MVEKMVEISGLRILGWRDVPVDRSVLGVLAESSCPRMEMVFVSGPTGGDALEKDLYLFRRSMRGACQNEAWDRDFYIASCSSRTVVYKGMVQAGVLSRYYKDLQNPLYKSVFCIFHRRFSTNTMPRWPLAQPMRVIAHNG